MAEPRPALPFPETKRTGELSGLSLAAPTLATVVILVLSVAGIALVLASTPTGGVGIDPDSLHYLSASEHVQAGEGFLRYDDELFLYWPPLFPLFIAVVDRLAGLVRLDLIEALRYAQALIYGLMVLCSGRLLRRVLRSPLLAVMGTLAVLLAFPLLRISVYLWSEALFALLIVVALLWLRQVLARPTPLNVAVLGLLLGLAWLQRYIGFTVLGAFALAILLWANATPRHRIGYAALTGAVASVLIVPWLARNWLVSGTLTGPRFGAEMSLEATLLENIHAVQAWFMPEALYLDNALLAAAILALVLVGLALAAYRHDRQTKASQPPYSAAVALVPLVYLLALFITSRFTNHSLGQRIVAPAYIPTIIAAFVGLEYAAGWLGERLGSVRAGLWAAMIAAGLWLLYPLSMTVREVQSFSWCCQHDSWRESALIDWLQTNPLEAPIYSNTPLPLLAGLDGRRIPAELEQLEALAEARGLIYLALFDERYRDSCAPDGRYCYHTDFDDDDLRAALPVERIAEVDDGHLYALRAPRGA